MHLSQYAPFYEGKLLRFAIFRKKNATVRQLIFKRSRSIIQAEVKPESFRNERGFTMKNFSKITWIMLLSVCVFGFATANAQTKANVNWDLFSENLVHALKSDNAGLRHSAMQLVIRHGENLNVRDALFDVVHIFRSNKDRNVRLLALAAISKMNSNWAMYFLKRSLKFEKDPVVQRHVLAHVTEYEHNKNQVESVALAQNF